MADLSDYGTVVGPSLSRAGVDLSQYGTVSQPAEPHWTEQLGAFMKGLSTAPIAHPLNMLGQFAGMVRHPIDTVNSVVDQQTDLAKKSEDAFKSGDYGRGIIHGMLSLIPLVGPAVDAPYEKMKDAQKSGDKLAYAEAAGELAGIGGSAELARRAPDIVKAAGEKMSGATVLPSAASLSPSEQSAVDFANQNNIPLPAGTATGNKFVKGAQAIAANQPLGAGVAKSAMAATRGALEDTGTGLADKVAPVATEESAGGGVTSALQSKVAEHSEGARTAYSKLAEIEAAPENTKSVQIGTEENPALDKLATTLTGKGFADLSAEDQAKIRAAAPKFGIDPSPTPITKELQLPVDMRPVKASLQPVYDELRQQMPIAQQQASPGLKAIENIINGEDHVSASTAEANLGAVKAIQRETSAGTKPRYLASQALSAFAPAVDRAIADAGPEAADALQQGRALTKAKYATRETLENLPIDEPVKVFSRLTANGDTAINLLRDVQSKAPGSIPAVGRAALQGMIDAATAEEGQSPGPARAAANWSKLGDATKQVLFPDPKLRSDLDNFFSLAKKVSENPNPSGSAVVGSLIPGGLLTLHNPISGGAWLLGGYGLAKLLYTPAGVKLLTDGMTVGDTAKGAALAAKIIKQVGAEAKPVALGALGSTGEPKQLEAAPASIATAEPKEAPAAFKVGDVVNLRNIGPVKITKVNDDYTFDYTPQAK